MNCRKVSRRLSAFIEGDLSGKEKTGIEEHIRNCRGCSRRYNDLKLVIETAGKLESVSPGPHFTNRLLCELQRRNSANSRIRLWRPRFVYSGAAFVVAAAVTLYVVGIDNSVAPVPTANSDINPLPVAESLKTHQQPPESGFRVSNEALKRDMTLTQDPASDSFSTDSLVLPKHYVQPVGVQPSNNNDEVVY